MVRGNALHRDGRVDEAAAIYREVLSRAPQASAATHMLGVVALQQGRFEEAQRLIDAAVSLDPYDAEALGNLGISYLRGGQVQAALEWFNVALKLRPHSPTALLNMGTALHALDRDADAIPVLQRAFSANPNSYAVCVLLGQCLVRCGEANDAVGFLEIATLAEPGLAEGWMHLAAALDAVGEHQRGLECAERARALDPQAAADVTAPARDLRSAQGRQAAASAKLLANCGYVLFGNGFSEEALDQFRRALELEPHSLTLRWVTALAQLKAIYQDVSEVEASRRAFAKSMDEVAAWASRAVGIEEPHNAVGFLQPFYLVYQPFSNLALLRRYGAICATWMATLVIERPYPSAGTRGGDAASLSGRKLRIGIASAHVKDHSVWIAITKGWVCHLDQTKFELFLFQLNRDADQETELARRTAAHVEDGPTTVAAWAQSIAASNLDVLVYPTIGMDRLTLQLACLRLAPVQAVSWGHPETSGLPSIDFFFSADAFEPRNGAENYTERLVRLPNLGVYVEPLAPPAATVELSSLNLPEDVPLLLCPGTPFKYSPLFDHVWVQIAQGLRKGLFRKSIGGRLVFFRTLESMGLLTEARIRRAFERAGLDFDAHVSIVANLERPKFFALMRRSALMLDTLGFSGFNTALQAIECDLPFLAYEGDFMRGRLASGIMRQLNLPELVATSPEDFVQKAIDLARDASRREELRAAIVQRRDRLFRDLGSVRAFEQELIAAAASAAETPTRSMAVSAPRNRESGEAIQSDDAAIDGQPDSAEGYYTRANALNRLGRWDAALADYDRAIALDPNFAKAYCNRGTVLERLASWGEALASYDRALALAPADPLAHYNRGSALKSLERFEESLASYEKAIALRSDYVEAYINRGTVLHQLRRHWAAISSFEQAIALDPARPEAYQGRGTALFTLRRFDEALASYERAIASNGGYSEAYLNRGNTLQQLQRHESAVASFDQAIDLRPGYAEAFLARASSLFHLKNYEAAIASYDRAFALEPRQRGLFGARLWAKLQICDWSERESDLQRMTEGFLAEHAGTMPFVALALVDSPATQLAAAQAWVREECPPDDALGGIPKRPRREKINIGYFSPDFRSHPVAQLTAGLLEHHDRSRFEITAFAFGPPSSDAMSTRVQIAVDRFVDVRARSDSEVAALARELGIDIAVDLGGFTEYCRTGIFALRAAPLQVSYLGYSGTMGADYMDYMVGDRTVIADAQRRHYRENIIYLPNSYLPNDSSRVIADIDFTRQQFGLPPEGFVFCCFNNSFKITPDTFDAWMRILARAPHSVLWLAQNNPTAMRNLRQEAAQRGIGPERLVFAGRLASSAEHLARHRAADLFLDTTPYNAHATAMDALWAGLPVLTRTGESFAGRVAASLLMTLELPELIAPTPEQYEALAVRLAANPEELGGIRRKLEATRQDSPLFNTALYTMNLESAYTQIYERYHANIPPGDIHPSSGGRA
jgi:predicted O-linked N-acetylglucosamine transferase (SPINDLY family)